MKNTRYLSVLCLILGFVYSTPVHSQAPTIINLSSPETGEKTHVAQQEINFLNGYHYEASPDRMHAYIGNYVNYSNPYSQIEFDNHQIDQNLAVGYTPGSANVSGVGSASYSIPIVIPSGTNDLVPELSVGYNSHRGNGLLGLGWDIGPISSISMTSTSWYQDGDVEEVRLDGEDKFLLDGQRLHVLTGTYGSDGATYGTEAESFQRVTSYGFGGITKWFKVETKHGLTIEYGKIPEARRTNEAENRTIEWRINKISDLSGNYVQYVYLKEGTNSILDRIRYTGNSAAGITPYNEVKFHYAIREDVNKVYVAGIGFDRKYVLDQIEITAEGEMFKRYDLEYGMNNSSLLKSITERGSDLSSLNSTIFKYGEESPDFEELVCSTFDGMVADIIDSRDFNSDGKSDILVQHYFYDSENDYLKTYDSWEIFTATSDNSFTHYASGAIPIGHQLFFDHRKDDIEIRGMSTHLDFYGDGSDDILLIKLDADGLGNVTLGALTILDINGLDDVSSYSPPYALGGYVSPSKFLHVGDFDGDGKDDIFWMRYGSPGNYTYSGRLITEHSGEKGVDLGGLAYLASAKKYLSSDFDGDGKEEIMVFYSNSCEIFEVKSKQELGTLPYKVEKIYHSSFPSHNDEVFPGDFNGDGKTDLLVESGSNWSIAYSSGKEYEVEPFSFVTTPDLSPEITLPSSSSGDTITISSVSQAIKIGDFNGDGQSDIFHIHDVSGTPNFDKYYSDGTSFNYKHNTSSYFFHYGNLVLGDYNGDGKDALFRNDNNLGSFSGLFYFDKDGTEFLLDKIKDGLGRETQFNYSWLPKNENYSKTTGATTQPVLKVQYPFSVVKSVLSEDGVGGIKQIKYFYEDAFYHYQGRGMLGFLKTVTEDLTMGTRNISIGELNPDYYFIQPKTTRNELLSGALISESTLDFTITDLGGVRYYGKLNSSVTYNDLNEVTTTVNHSYDVYGNLMSKQISNGRENSNLVYNYGTFGLWWIPSAMLKKNIYNTRTGELTHSSKFEYTYDSFGRLIQEVSDPALSMAVTTDYEYDTFGNQIKRTISASGVPTVLTSTKLDSKGRFPIEGTNPIGQMSYTSYDKKWGAAISSTDESGLTTTGSYDAFGRQVSSIDPYGIETYVQSEWDLTTGTPSPTSANHTVYKISTEVDNAPTKTRWFDIYERPVKEKCQGLTDDVYSVKKFTEKGQDWTTTSPFFSGETPLVNTSTYDDFGRVTAVSDGISTTNYSYSVSSGELTVSMSHPSQNRTRTTDQSGRTIQTSDNAGTVDFDYYSNGRQKEVSVQGVLLQQMIYDSYGNQISLNDKDAGITTYDYNAYHALISQTDANGDTHSKTYDNLGREIGSTGPDGVTTTSYVTSGEGLNQVESISNPYGVTTSYNYDSYNRLVSTTESIDAENFTTGFEYNDDHQLEKLVYPSGFKAKFSYSSIGELINVTDDSETTMLFSAPVKNARGQYESYILGNGKTSQFTYGELGLLETAFTVGVQDYEVLFNQFTGNVVHRMDHLHNRKETFTYDASQRLKTASITLVTSPVVIGTPLIMDYSSNGNILEKSDVGNYSYDPVKIHAVTSIDNTVGSIPFEQQDMTYTSFDRTSTVSEGDHFVSFTYGTALNRIKFVQSLSGSVVKTKYYVGSYQKEITTAGVREIHYIPTGNGSSATYVVEDGVGSYHYSYSDHLGSIVAVTDAAGLIEFEQSFDAWGQRRNPSSWVGTMTVPDAFSWVRGFTGHEHLDEFGLINMNNRMYDPIIGRMLAVDNFIQSPDFTQNYNRYSYVLNNPIGFSDPSGELFFGPIIAGAVVGALIGGLRAEMNGIPTWQGALTGGLYGASIGYSISAFLTSAFYIKGSAGSLIRNTLPTSGDSFKNLGEIGGKAVIKGTKLAKVTKGFSIISNGFINSGVNMTSYILQTLSPNVDFDRKRLLVAGLIGFGAGVIGGAVGSVGAGTNSVGYLNKTNFITNTLNGVADRTATDIFNTGTIDKKTLRNAIYGGIEGFMAGDMANSFYGSGGTNQVLKSITSYAVGSAITSVPGLSSFLYSFVGPYRFMDFAPKLHAAFVYGNNVAWLARISGTQDYGFQIGEFHFGPTVTMPALPFGSIPFAY